MSLLATNIYHYNCTVFTKNDIFTTVKLWSLSIGTTVFNKTINKETKSFLRYLKGQQIG